MKTRSLPCCPALPHAGQPCAVQPKELSLKNCRQRCGPSHAPSGHNFSKPFTPLDKLCPGYSSLLDGFIPRGKALLPVIAEQGGTPALRETARAIGDTAKWWP